MSTRSSPLCVSMRGDVVCDRYADIVSIHAPTRGATLVKQLSELERKVSIHAPTRGAT